MSGFLYYIPGAEDNYDPSQGKLSYAFQTKPNARRCFQGPDGGAGVVFNTKGDIGYYSDRQTWTEVEYLGCWIGYFTDKPPKEIDLRRNKILAGHSLELNGEQWQIPIARSFAEFEGKIESRCALSTYLTINFKTGDWKSGEIFDEYQPLWKAAMRFWEIWWDANIGEGKDAELTDEVDGKMPEIEAYELEDMTTLVLSTNYHLGRAEIAILQLLKTEDCYAALSIITDLDSFSELVKKNLTQQGSSSTDNGKPVEPQPTPQLSLIG